MTVWDRMLIDKDLRTAVLELDEQYGLRGPLNSVYKLNEVVKICRTVEAMLYCINRLADLVRNGDVTSEELAIRTLNGKGMGGKGLLHLLMYKRHAMLFGLDFIDTHAFDPEVRLTFKRCFSNFGTFRKAFGYSGEDVDLTWMNMLPPSGALLHKLFEDGLLIVCLQLKIAHALRPP
jgi:hypothetical protein